MTQADSYEKFTLLMNDILELAAEIRKDLDKEFSQEYLFENSLEINLDP